MSKPRKTKKDVWTCPKGCSNAKIACEHLEALLSQDGGQGLHKYLSYLPDDVITQIPPPPPHDNQPLLSQYDYNHYTPTCADRHEFIEQLRNAGLIHEEIVFMVEKYILNKPVRTIAKEHGFTSKSTAGYFFRKIKKKLKTRGLKLWRAKYDD